jgi:hypothetical protein
VPHVALAVDRVEQLRATLAVDEQAAAGDVGLDQRLGAVGVEAVAQARALRAPGAEVVAERPRPKPRWWVASIPPQPITPSLMDMPLPLRPRERRDRRPTA